MKLTPFPILLQLVGVFICASWGAAADGSQDSAESIAKRVSACRARGETITGLREMHRLMEQWSPIGLSRDKLIGSLGAPTSSSDKATVYRFDFGDGGWQWVFDIENGLVAKVHKVSLE